MAKLGDVCEIVSGSTPKTSNDSYWNGDLCWITPAEISETDVVINDTERKITREGAQSCALTLMPIGTILLSSRAPIGKVAIAGKEMYCNQGFKNLICSDAVYNKYLYWFLKHNHDYLNSLGRGATFKEISKKIVADIEIPLPPLSTQKQIAANLDKATQTIDLCNAILEKLDLLVKAKFVEMFGDPELNQKGFPMFKMSDIVVFQGGSQPDKKHFEYEPSEDNIRLIQIRDYRTDKYITYIPKSLAKRHCTADDIMIGRYGPPIFQILQGIEGSYNVALMKAVPKRGNKEFIRYFLKQECLLHYLEGMSKRTAGQDGIQMDKLKAYPFPFPPLELQNQFAAFVEKTDRTKAAVKQVLAKAETLKKALMQEYFG